MKDAILEDNIVRCTMLADVKEILGLELSERENIECNYGVVEE